MNYVGDVNVYPWDWWEAYEYGFHRPGFGWQWIIGYFCWNHRGNDLAHWR